MIICVNKEPVQGQEPKIMRCVLQADTAEDVAKNVTTGAGVIDLADTVELYPSSILVCLQDSKRYIFGCDKAWHEFV